MRAQKEEQERVAQRLREAAEAAFEDAREADEERKAAAAAAAEAARRAEEERSEADMMLDGPSTAGCAPGEGG